MPEATRDGVLLIATSYQALYRASLGDERTMITDCTVVIVFAGFFIEANLNYIIATLGKDNEVVAFNNRRPNPGLGNKLAWFYNAFIAPTKARTIDQVSRTDLYATFPGFQAIYDFRNNIAHGHIDLSLTNFRETERLRRQAKDIVDNLFSILTANACDIPRLETYNSLISTSNPGASLSNLSSDASS